jgi:hypothetical protein
MDEVGIASSFGSSGPWCGRAWACGETLCPQPRAPRGVTADAIERLEREQPAAMATWRRILEDRTSGSVRGRRHSHSRSPFHRTREDPGQGY